LDTNVSEGCSASIFKIEVRGERKVDIEMYRQGMRRGGTECEVIVSVGEKFSEQGPRER
jgi:hypothetical protein